MSTGVGYPEFAMSIRTSSLVGAAILTAISGACSEGAPASAPRLLNANVFDFPFSEEDGGRIISVEIDLDAVPVCVEDGPLPLYGIVIDTNPDDEPADPDENLFLGLDPELRITAECVGGQLQSTAGDVFVADTADGARITIAVDGSELPSEFGWLAFVADGDQIQRSPASPEIMVWRSLVID